MADQEMKTTWQFRGDSRYFHAMNSKAPGHRIQTYAWRAPVVGLILMIFTGCPGMSARDNQRFQTLVARTVSPGMPFVTAIEKLVKSGFSCDDRVSAPLVTCTLDRQSLLPYACLERVDLTTDSERRTVTLVTARPIACAGL